MKKTDKKYGLVALCMCFFLMGTVALLEQRADFPLLIALLFCCVCSGVLLFCLMKLNVMEFRENTFWYRINQKVNQELNANIVQENRKRCVQQQTARPIRQSPRHCSAHRKIA